MYFALYKLLKFYVPFPFTRLLSNFLFPLYYRHFVALLQTNSYFSTNYRWIIDTKLYVSLKDSDNGLFHYTPFISDVVRYQIDI
jgi:hypothetical protein